MTYGGAQYGNSAYASTPRLTAVVDSGSTTSIVASPLTASETVSVRETTEASATYGGATYGGVAYGSDAAEVETVDPGSTTSIVASPKVADVSASALDSGSTTSIVASPLTADAVSIVDIGSTSPIVASPLDSTEFLSVIDPGSTTPIVASSLDPTELLSVLGPGSTTSIVASLHQSSEILDVIEEPSFTSIVMSPKTTSDLFLSILDTGSTTSIIASPLTAVVIDSWLIDGDLFRPVIDEASTSQTLSLSLRASGTEISDLRRLKSDEGKISVIQKDDGGYVALDRANGSNTYDLVSPSNRKPLRRDISAHVSKYEESKVSQSTDEWDVEIEFQKSENRTDSPSLSQARASEEWAFETRYGTIATDRVYAELKGTGEGGVERYELEVRMSKEQTHVFEASYERLNGGRIKTIPDAPNQAVDDTSDEAATLTLTTPDSEDQIDDGDYLVTGWESKRISDATQLVSISLAKI